MRAGRAGHQGPPPGFPARREGQGPGQPTPSQTRQLRAGQLRRGGSGREHSAPSRGAGGRRHMSAHPHTARAQRLPSKARVNTAHSVRRARRSPQPGRRLSGQRAHNRSSVRSPRETAAWLVGRVCFLEHQSFGPKGEGAAFGDSRAATGNVTVCPVSPPAGEQCRHCGLREPAVPTSRWPKPARRPALSRRAVGTRGRLHARPQARGPRATNPPSRALLSRVSAAELVSEA